MPAPISNDLIITLLERHLAVNPDRLVISEWRAGDFEEACRVESDQGEFVLRLALPSSAKTLFYARGMLRREVGLLTLTRAHTTIPAPEVVAYDFGQQLLERDFLIVKALPGVCFSEVSSLSHAQHNQIYFQLGEYLRQLHTIRGSGYGYNAPSAFLEAQPNWEQTFKLMWRQLIKDVVACGMYSQEEGQSLAALLDNYQAYFERQPPSVLLHMGVRKENIMVDRQGNVTGLMGFETALWGEPELEFASLDCAGIWASAFWEGYGQPRPNNLGSRIRRQFYILYEIQKNIPLSVWRHYDLEEAEQYKQTTMTLAANLAAQEP